MRVRGDSLGSSRLETQLPHLDAGGTRSSDDVRSAVMSGKRHDEIGPALIEHRRRCAPAFQPSRNKEQAPVGHDVR